MSDPAIDFTGLFTAFANEEHASDIFWFGGGLDCVVCTQDY